MSSYAKYVKINITSSKPSCKAKANIVNYHEYHLMWYPEDYRVQIPIKSSIMMDTLNMKILL